MTKIRKIDELAEILEKLRSRKKRIVCCHGVFDLLHIGHIRYFSQARQRGDILVVTITPDRYVDKGPDRPAFAEILRAEAVASLDCVDYVAINEWPTAEETLRRLRPDVYVKGSEYKDISSDRTGKIADEKKVVDEIGAELAFTEDIVFSSTNLINRYLSSRPAEVDKYLKLFSQRHTLDDILKTVDRMRDLKVLVVGDIIIDEYQFCEAIGKSSKDPALVLKHESSDLFAGGVLAVANHIANFADSVSLVSVIGENEGHEEFIRSQLNGNISSRFFVQPCAPTIVKRRFVDGYSFNKLFEVYVMDDSGLPPEQDCEMCKCLQRRLEECDLVIAADFGHGAISRNAVQLLSKSQAFLAVNTQANAGNRGFHTITRYSRADYASIADHELKLETRNGGQTLREDMQDISETIGCHQFVVTLGRRGCAVYSRKGGFVKVPAFAGAVVDRVGAGDAFFAITSLASKLDVDNEVVGFLGNIAGSIAVEVIGNKKSIEKGNVEKYVTSLMK